MACIVTMYKFLRINMLAIAVTERWFEAFASLTKQDTNPPTS